MTRCLSLFLSWIVGLVLLIGIMGNAVALEDPVNYSFGEVLVSKDLDYGFDGALGGVVLDFYKPRVVFSLGDFTPDPVDEPGLLIINGNKIKTLADLNFIFLNLSDKFSGGYLISRPVKYSEDMVLAVVTNPWDIRYPDEDQPKNDIHIVLFKFDFDNMRVKEVKELFTVYSMFDGVGIWNGVAYHEQTNQLVIAGTCYNKSEKVGIPYLAVIDLKNKSLVWEKAFEEWKSVHERWGGSAGGNCILHGDKIIYSCWNITRDWAIYIGSVNGGEFTKVVYGNVNSKRGVFIDNGSYSTFGWINVSSDELHIYDFDSNTFRTYKLGHKIAPASHVYGVIYKNHYAVRYKGEDDNIYISNLAGNEIKIYSNAGTADNGGNAMAFTNDTIITVFGLHPYKWGLGHLVMVRYYPNVTQQPQPKPLPKLHLEKRDGKWKLVDENGNVVVLRGVNIPDPYYLDYKGKFNEEFFKRLHSMGVNVIRVPVHPIFWKKLGAEKYTTKYLDKIIEWAYEYKFYVILDWHAIGNIITGETIETKDWMKKPPWNANSAWDIYRPNDVSLAKNFLEYVSSKYKDETCVIYDIYNEPAYISWNEWKPKAEELIDVVRQNDPDSLIIVGGIDFAYDLSGVKSNPINKNNVIYAVHVYPNRPYDEWDSKWGKIADKYPVMLTEWGFDLNVTNITDEEHLLGTPTYADKLFEYIINTEKTVGHLAWCYSADWEPNMLEDDWYSLTAFGRFVEDIVSPLELSDGMTIKINGYNNIQIDYDAYTTLGIIVVPSDTKFNIEIYAYIDSNEITKGEFEKIVGSKAELYIDGIKIAESSPIDDDGCFTFNAEVKPLIYGEHKAKIVAGNYTRELAIFAYKSAKTTIDIGDPKKFVITRDTYRFSNYGVDFLDLRKINDTINNILDYIYLQLPNFINILTPPILETILYPFLVKDGHCFGMSYTVSLFFTGSLDPPRRPVYDLQKNEVKDIILKYQIKQIYAIRDYLLRSFITPTVNEIYTAKDLIDNNDPPVIGIQIQTINGSGGHALTAIGYIQTAEELYFIVYDSKKPGKYEVILVPKYLEYINNLNLKDRKDDSRIYAIYYTGSNEYHVYEYHVYWIRTDKPTPYWDIKDLANAILKLITELIELEIAIINANCPIDINITDENGNQLLIINNTVVVNTLNANVFIVNDSKTIILPANRTYTITLIGTGNGSVNITELTPVGNNITALNVTFNVQNGSIVTIKTLNGSAMIKDVNIDYDNDGVLDETLKPNITANVSVRELMKLLAPVASFTYAPSNPTTADIIQFTDQSYDPDGTIVAWHWDFGDGTTSNVQNPTHRYTKAGTYTVTLTVTDNDGNTNSTSKTIVVRPVTTTTTTTPRHYYGGGGLGAGGGGYVVYQTTKPTPTATVTATPLQTVATQVPTTTETTPTQVPLKTPIKTTIHATTVTTTPKKSIPGFTTILTVIALFLAILTIKRRIR